MLAQGVDPAAAKLRVASMTENASALPPLTSNDSTAPPWPFCCQGGPPALGERRQRHTDPTATISGSVVQNQLEDSARKQLAQRQYAERAAEFAQTLSQDAGVTLRPVRAMP